MKSKKTVNRRRRVEPDIDWMSDEMQRLMEHQLRVCEIAAELYAKTPTLGITAYIIAGDLASAERMERIVAAGKLTALQALNYIGSYARFDFAVKHLTDEDLFPLLPELWSESDPDDTNPAYLALWNRAFAANRNRIIYDNKALKLPRDKWLMVYRGQSKGDPLGIAWSTELSVAERFARGASMRRPIPNPVVYSTPVQRCFVRGYLTGRGEHETIIDLQAAGLKLEHFSDETEWKGTTL